MNMVKLILMEEINRQLGWLVVLSGPAASGKDTIIARLQKIYPHFGRIVTTTTRLPRINEQEGREHYFVDLTTFQKMSKEGKFLETMTVAGYFYGTLKQELEPLFKGKSLFWTLEGYRASHLQETFKIFTTPLAEKIRDKTLIIYLQTDQEIIRRRLKTRGWNEAEINARLKKDLEDWQNSHFSNVVKNTDGKLDRTIEEIRKLISSKILV